MFGKLSHIISGEFLLRSRPNGGGIVFARAVYVTTLAYCAALALKGCTTAGATLGFSPHEFVREVNATIPWAGAIFAGVYVAFYTRYSNQWSYLASTYNQIMAVKATLSGDMLSANRVLVAWQAGFITDAYTLHLDRKEVFKGAIASLLADDKIRQEVLGNFTGKELQYFQKTHLPNNSMQRTQTRCAG